MTHRKARGQISLRKVANTDVKVKRSRITYRFSLSNKKNKRRPQKNLSIFSRVCSFIRLVNTIVFYLPVISKSIKAFHEEISRYWQMFVGIIVEALTDLFP
jgi:hypothetical protein